MNARLTGEIVFTRHLNFGAGKVAISSSMSAGGRPK
jgi:hypothetical protein